MGVIEQTENNASRSNLEFAEGIRKQSQIGDNTVEQEINSSVGVDGQVQNELNPVMNNLMGVPVSEHLQVETQINHNMLS